MSYVCQYFFNYRLLFTDIQNTMQPSKSCFYVHCFCKVEKTSFAIFFLLKNFACPITLKILFEGPDLLSHCSPQEWLSTINMILTNNIAKRLFIDQA